MEFNLINIFVSVGAGFVSILSPCVLPILPIIVLGTEKDNKLKPLLLVLGLTITFVLMGIASSAFGSLLVGKIEYVEKIGGLIIFLFGAATLMDINLFKKMYWLSNIQVNNSGPLAGLFIGLSLGVVWLPCIGPILSSILAMVATEGQLDKGVIYLVSYSIGFGIPILLMGYLSHLVRHRMNFFREKSVVLRMVTGLALMSVGLYILVWGTLPQL